MARPTPRVARRAFRAPALLLLALVTACSSTAVERRAGPGGDVPVTLEPVTPSTVPSAPTGDGARPAPAPSGASTSDGGRASPDDARSSATRTPAVGAGPPRRDVGRDGPGVTRDAIALGVVLNETARQRLVSSGISLDAGDPLAALQVAADVLNERGGIAGRRVELVPWRYDGPEEQYASAVCARYTEDDEVFAVLQHGAAGPTTRTCFAERAMPVIDAFGTSLSERDRTPHHYTVASMTLERLTTTLVDQLALSGFFTAGKRIGVVTFDDRTYRRLVRDVLRPRLREHGHALTAAAYLPYDIGSATRQSPGAVAAFREQGVDLVLVLEGHTGVSGPFTGAAAAQQAEFRYGLASPSGPSAQAQGRKYLIDESALRRATVVGWHSLGDLLYAQGGIREMPPVAHQWRRTLEQRGLRYRDQCCALGLALSFVERLLFLKAGLELAGGPVVNADRFRLGVERLGPDYQSVLTGRTSFGPGRYDGVAAVRYARWSDGCDCLQYVSSEVPLGTRAQRR